MTVLRCNKLFDCGLKEVESGSGRREGGVAGWGGVLRSALQFLEV